MKRVLEIDFPLDGVALRELAEVRRKARSRKVARDKTREANAILDAHQERFVDAISNDADSITLQNMSCDLVGLEDQFFALGFAVEYYGDSDAGLSWAL